MEKVYKTNLRGQNYFGTYDSLVKIINKTKLIGNKIEEVKK